MGSGPLTAGVLTPFSVRPFPGRRLAIVAATLAGGAAWSWLVKAIQEWLKALGLPSPREQDLFSRLNELGSKAVDEVVVQPHFAGERHTPSLRGAISGITMDNFDLGSVARGLARGILANLKAMLPAEALAGRQALVGSGNALARNPLLRTLAEEVFGLPLRMAAAREEAACGAARMAAGLVQTCHQP